MNYTFISAQYSNDESSVAVVETVESSFIIVSSADTPELWAQLQSADLEIVEFIAPSVIPVVVTRRQLHLALNQMGLRAAVLTWAASADIATQIEFEMANEYRRDHHMWPVGAAALGKTEAEIDQLFILAATL